MFKPLFWPKWLAYFHRFPYFHSNVSLLETYSKPAWKLESNFNKDDSRSNSQLVGINQAQVWGRGFTYSYGTSFTSHLVSTLDEFFGLKLLRSPTPHSFLARDPWCLCKLDHWEGKNTVHYSTISTTNI